MMSIFSFGYLVLLQNPPKVLILGKLPCKLLYPLEGEKACEKTGSNPLLILMLSEMNQPVPGVATGRNLNLIVTITLGRY